MWEQKKYRRTQKRSQQQAHVQILYSRRWASGRLDSTFAPVLDSMLAPGLPVASWFEGSSDDSSS